MMHHTQRLAWGNGRCAFNAGRHMADSNPYPKSRKSHASFNLGWLEAERESKSTTDPLDEPQ